MAILEKKNKKNLECIGAHLSHVPLKQPFNVCCMARDSLLPVMLSERQVAITTLYEYYVYIISSNNCDPSNPIV